MSTRSVMLLSILLAACDGETGKDGDGNGGTTTDTGQADTGDPVAADAKCTSSHIDRLSVSAAGGDTLSILLQCEDATLVSGANLVVGDLEIGIDFAGEASEDGREWRGKSLSELEELVAEKGLSYGMDVSHYLDEDKISVPNNQHIAVHDPAPEIRSRGYRPADENKVPGAPIGEIAIDSIFTPISGGGADLDGDGDLEQVQAWVMTLDAEAGTAGVGTCILDADADCAPEGLLDGLDVSAIAAENPLFAAQDNVFTNNIQASEAEEKGQATFAVAVSGPKTFSLGVLNTDQDGAGEAISATLAYETLGLAASTDGAPDPQTMPVVGAIRADFNTSGGNLTEKLGAWTVTGAGFSSRDGSALLWGATLKGSEVVDTWSSALDLDTLMPEATLIAGMGTEVLVFFGARDGALTILNVDASSGKTVSSLSLPEVSSPTEIRSAIADVDGDGINEAYAAVLSDDGALSLLSGELSTSAGFAKANTETSDLFDSLNDGQTDSFTLEAMAIDGGGNVAVTASVSVVGEQSAWVATGRVAGDELGLKLDSVELYDLGTATRIVASGGSQCGDAVEGFCGLALRQAGDSGAFTDGAPILYHSLDWRGDEARGIPLVGTENYTLVATGGEVLAYTNDGAVVGEPAPISPIFPTSAFEHRGRLHYQGCSISSTTSADTLCTAELGSWSVAADGSAGLTVIAQGADFQIPEKVVMEKDDDFYGRASSGEPTGATAIWTELEDTDGDGVLDSSSLVISRLDLDDLAGAGEEVVLDQRDARTGKGLLAHELTHTIQQGARMGPSAVVTSRGSVAVRDILRGGVSAGSGVVALGSLADSGATDDVIAVMPWETGTECGLATVWVPGTTLDWSANLGGAIVLSTATQPDCSDLAVPVGGLDPDGQGAGWPVLAHRDDSTGTTTFTEVVWDGSALLQLPGITVPYTAFTEVTVGDINHDGRDDLFLVPVGADFAILAQTNGRSLAPVDEDGSDFADGSIYEDDIDTLYARMVGETLDAADSRALREDSAAPWFWLVDDPAGAVLSSSRSTQGSTGVWSARAEIEHPRIHIHHSSWASILEPLD